MKIAFAICIFVVAASSRNAVAASADEYANIHSFGIISAIGQSISLVKIGSTVFGNDKSTLSTPDWGIDELVVHKVAELLAPRFTVQPVVVDTAPLESDNSGLLRDGPDVKSFILGLPQGNGVDAYIVIRKSLVQDIWNGTNQYLWGLGIYRHHLIFGGNRDAVYAFYQVQIVDAKTGNIIDYGIPRTTDGSFLSAPQPWDSSDPANWAETPDAMTDQQKQAIKAKLLALVDISLPRAL